MLTRSLYGPSKKWSRQPYPLHPDLSIARVAKSNETIRNLQFRSNSQSSTPSFRNGYTCKNSLIVSLEVVVNIVRCLLPDRNVPENPTPIDSKNCLIFRSCQGLTYMTYHLGNIGITFWIITLTNDLTLQLLWGAPSCTLTSKKKTNEGDSNLMGRNYVLIKPGKSIFRCTN